MRLTEVKFEVEGYIESSKYDEIFTFIADALYENEDLYNLAISGTLGPDYLDLVEMVPVDEDDYYN
jgi:hypothetical protein